MTIYLEEFEFYQNRSLLKPLDNSLRKLNGLFIDYTKI